MDQAVRDRIQFVKNHPELQQKVRFGQALEIITIIIWLVALIPALFIPSDFTENVFFALIIVVIIFSELIVMNGLRYIQSSLAGYLDILFIIAAFTAFILYNPIALGFTQTSEDIKKDIFLGLFLIFYVGSKYYIKHSIKSMYKQFEQQTSKVAYTR